jgi:hypothetical protein
LTGEAIQFALPCARAARRKGDWRSPVNRDTILYWLPPVSSFLDLAAMATLRRRMQVLRKIWPEMPLPLPLVISFFLLFLFSLRREQNPNNHTKFRILPTPYS